MHDAHTELGSQAAPRLALRPREAAAALGISDRKLWSLTAANEVPHTRLGRALLYPIDGLRRWLNERAGVESGA